MPLQSSGVPIRLSEIAAEFGGTPPYKFSQFYRGGGRVPDGPAANSLVPASGTWRIGKLYGATAAVAPGAPAAPTAVVASSTSITVSWAAPASDGGSAVQGYRLYVSSASDGVTFSAAVLSNPTTLITLTSKTLTGLTSGSTYRFYVSAVNSVGEGAASGLSAGLSTATVPGAPGTPTATLVTCNSVALAWTAPASDGGSAVLGYRVYVSADNGVTWTLYNSALVTGTALTLENLQSDVSTYAFGVVATNAVGNGAQSPSSFALSTAVPATGTTPNWAQVVRIQASDALMSGGFGWSLSASRTGHIVVGATGADTGKGAAYMFVRAGMSTWTQQAKLVAPDTRAVGDDFGWAVAASGDGFTVAAGAPGSGGVGGVYVFVRSGGIMGTTWSYQAKVQAASPASLDRFGAAVALSSDGSTLAVGAPSDDGTAGVNAGSVHVFARTGTSWSVQWSMEGSAAGDGLGYSVSLSSNGNTLAAGAPFAWANTGAVNLYTRSSSTWSSTLLIEGIGTDYFGWAVSLNASGSEVTAGGPQASTIGGGAGVVYTYETSGPSAAVTVVGAPADSLGWSVAGSIYGAPGASTATGRAFAFNAATWNTTVLQASDKATDDDFGNSVAEAGDTVALGAYRDDNSGGTNAGSVYLFTFGPPAAPGTPAVAQVYAAAGTAYFDMSWTAPAAGNVTKYNVYLDAGTVPVYTTASTAPTGVGIVVSAGSHTFTVKAVNGYAEGPGATSASVTVASSGTVTKTFAYTGADQTWTVPPFLSSVNVKLWGAGGGASSSTYNRKGGAGGYAAGTLAVTPGATLKVVVGGGGKTNGAYSAYGGGK